MESNQSTKDGVLLLKEDPPHPSVDQREVILRNALLTLGWSATIERESPNGQFVKFNAKVDKSDHKYTLKIYIFPNLASTSRGNIDEKRIQLTRPFKEHADDFLLNKTGEVRCLLFGIYVLDLDNVIFCAWDAAAYVEHADPTSCYVNIHAIAEAFRDGFGRSQDKKHRFVCCFRPEFIHYYIENMKDLHVVTTTADSIVIENIVPHGSLGGDNIIYYGAPGTGKTYSIDKLINNKKCIRTVFHPETQNTDFIGSLKPFINNGTISYQFSPGPFAQAIKSALSDPDNEVYLVIEEINRAPAAAVFGDVFLLLDRREDGTGRYDVDFPTNEFKNWLNENLGTEIAKLLLPSNLWILASMNSADQGVYPLDTAFRRRWRQVYVPIDYEDAPEFKLTIGIDNNNAGTILWVNFIRSLNMRLSSKLRISEDRLVGPWFVKPEEVENGIIPGKLLIYLWDDLLRHEGREIIFDDSYGTTYGDIHSRAANNKKIFSDSFINDMLELFEPSN